MTRSILSVLREATARLVNAGAETPQLDAQLMLASVLECSRLDLIARPERELLDTNYTAYQLMLERRAAREPLPYITGHKEFYGLEIDVSPGVLIPRPETEMLVEECVRRIGQPAPLTADIGVGSGAIAVAVAVALPGATVYATDISPEALQVAAGNAGKHAVSSRVTMLRGDLVAPLCELGLAFDAVLSNPPYIPTGEIPGLQLEVSRYEPVGALDGGPDGLDVYRKLLPDAKPLLREGGFVAVEVGAGQADAVAEIVLGAGYRDIERIRDLAGIERVVVAYR